MKLIPHHQDDKAGRREYRSPDGTWRVTTAATPGGESTAVTTMAPKQRETPERSAEPPPPSPRRTPRRPITHYIDETRSEDIRWSLCGVFLYDEKQIAKGDEPAKRRGRRAVRHRENQVRKRASVNRSPVIGPRTLTAARSTHWAVASGAAAAPPRHRARWQGGDAGGQIRRPERPRLAAASARRVACHPRPGLARPASPDGGFAPPTQESSALSIDCGRALVSRRGGRSRRIGRCCPFERGSGWKLECEL